MDGAFGSIRFLRQLSWRGLHCHRFDFPISPDGGDRWKAIVHDLPAVLSVEVQTIA
jgi:hypothetical protein